MISDELKQIYTNHSDTRMFYDAIELTHVNFSPTSKYLIRANEDMTLNVDSTPTLFQAFPFNIVMPEQGSDQQDIAIVLDNVSQEIIAEIESASSNPETPIKLTYRIYIDDDLDTQITPIILYLTNIVVDNYVISATATRSDLYNRRFPFGNTAIFDRRFIGLYL